MSLGPIANTVPNTVPNTVIDECESTNDLARQLAEAGAPHGTWVSARTQGSGRGRLGRKWESIDGNLFLSVIARIEPSASWSWVPLATAVAVAECLREFNPKIEVEIKWPNDLWLNRCKLGGILCEAMGNRSSSFVIIGLGLNCIRAPQGLDQRTISLTEFLSRAGNPVEVRADDVRLPLVASIVGILDDLQRSGHSAVVERYNRFAALKPGTPIEWVSSEKNYTGTVEGMGASGELRVRMSDGSPQKLYAEDVKVRPAALR